jgi:Ca2+-binding RTX toxin-like protein
VGGRYFGRIEKPGDSDWIAVTLEAGVTYTFNLGPGTANADVVFDSALGLYDAAGTQVAFNEDVGFTAISNPGIGGLANPWNYYSFIEFTPTATGTYYLAAGTFNDGPESYVGDYVLSAFAGDLPGDTTTPAVLEVGGASMTTRLDQSGDSDGFKVATVAGEYYTVSVTQSGDFVQLLAPWLEARDTDGVVLATAIAFEHLSTQLTFQATSSITWLDVAGGFPGFDIGQYSIQIEEASLVDAIEHPWWRPLPANVTVYFAEGVDITNAAGESFSALAWTPEGMSAALSIFQHYSDVANITFTVVDSPAEASLVIANRLNADLFAGQSVDPFIWGHPTEINGVPYDAQSVELYLDYPGMTEGNFAPGTFAYAVLSHEIGHGLGLSHPHHQFLGDATIPGLLWSFENGDFALGQGVYTQMSYNFGFSEKDGSFLPPFTGLAEYGGQASPMAVDIAALQQIYGANTTTRTGNDTYVLPDANAPGTGYVTIWDNGGTDTIAAATTNTSGVTIDLRPASLDYDELGGGAVSWARGVHGGFTIAHGVVVENAIGAAGDDRLVGNAAANRLEGRAGNDEMGGGAGDDRLLGGAGNDRLFGDALPGKPSGIGFGSGLVVSDAGAGNDSVETAWDITDAFALFADPDIANAQTIPHVTIEGTGDGSMDIFKVTLERGATLTIDMDYTTGGFDPGVGIATADLNFLAVFNDGLVHAGAGGSVSQVDSYGTFTAWDGGTYYIVVRDALFPDVAPGQSYELHVSVAATTDAVGAGAGNDHLGGGDGDDYLDGGAGRDTMIGGDGDDVFVVDNRHDEVVEKRNEGRDTIQSSVSLDLDDVAKHVENLTLTGTADLSGYGNDLDNAIIGNGGANRLKGVHGDDRLEGGLGNDRLEGGSGDDWLDGGLGNDRLEGGSGDDKFYFGDWLGSSNVDTMVDFNRHDDSILLDDEVFLGLSVGSLQSSAFKVLGWGSHVDADDRVLYSAYTGDLFFDQDGSGTAYHAIRFANIANNAGLSASDFLIV